MAIVKLTAPWQTYYKELSLLFGHDDEVRIIYDTDDQIINIYVDDVVKAEAMAAVLPAVKQFGSVELEINIVSSNRRTMFKASKGTGFVDLFRCNPIVKDVIVIDEITSNPITYVIFKKEVVQYFNDDLGDAHGVCSTLYQDIAKRVFNKIEGVFFCTDTSSDTMTSYKIPSEYTTITTSGFGF